MDEQQAKALFEELIRKRLGDTAALICIQTALLGTMMDLLPTAGDRLRMGILISAAEARHQLEDLGVDGRRAFEDRIAQVLKRFPAAQTSGSQAE